MGECDSAEKEILMPGVVPSAQGGSRPGGRPAGARDVPGNRPGRRRPGSIGGAVAQAGGYGGSSPRETPAGGHGRSSPRTTARPEQPDDGPYTIGQEIEVTVGDVAQGGWCVARLEGLPVIFVRHALPGEVVLARVTEVTAKFARADAVEIRDASPDRVPPPCP